MADYTVKSFDEMEPILGGFFLRVRAALGGALSASATPVGEPQGHDRAGGAPRARVVAYGQRRARAARERATEAGALCS